MRMLILSVLCCSVALAANDFSSDAAVQGLYLFEDNLNDSSPATGGNGANDLTSVTGIDYSTTFIEGSKSGDLELGDRDDPNIADASLGAGFPAKSGTTNRTISVCFWVRFESLPASGQYRYLVSKYVNAAGQRSFRSYLTNASGTYNWYWDVYTTAGGNITMTPTNAVTTGQWYHFAATADAEGHLYLAVYDNANNKEDTGTGTTASEGPMVVGTAPLEIGGSSALGRFHDGLLDEIVITNDELSADEIRYIRGGTYPDGPASSPIGAVVRRRHQ